MKYALGVFLAVAVAFVALQPLAAFGQNGCDPTTSYCGGSTTSGQQLQLPTLQNPTVSGTTPGQQQSPYGTGGANPAGSNLNIPGQSIDLQGVPNYIDNLNGLGGRTEATNARTYPLYYQRFFAPDQPTEFQRLVNASVGQMLPIYGAKLFLQSPSTFAPVDQVPVTSNYVVGPGDQLLIRVWGQMNFNAEVTVDREGMVYVPHVGGIHVGGIPYTDLQQQVRDAVGRIYKNFDLSVNLGQLHPIRIFVTGQARYPGSYTVSSLSTLVSAIFATGGPAPQGSMRHILLRRNGTTVADLDMYDLLVNGDKSHDMGLLPGDVIYIPPAGPQVAVYGSVRSPAIYELKDRKETSTLGEVLADAGGLSSTASVSRASLERIDPEQHQRALDVVLDTAGKNTPLQDGDIVRVLPISPSFDQTVTLRGNVADPGRFAWHPGMKLSELLPNSEALVTRDYWQKRNQLGLPSPVFQPDYAQRFTAYRQTQAESQRQYFLYLQRDQEKRLYDQQQAAQQAQQTGGTAGTGALPSNAQAPPVDLNAQAAMSNNMGYGTGTSELTPPQQPMPGTVPDQPVQNTQNTIPRNDTIGGGSLADEQRIARTENTATARYLNDVSLMAPEIDWSYAVIERMDPVTLKTSLIPFDLGKLVREHDPAQDLAVEPHDVITIFSQADIRVPQSQQTKLVRIEGEVEHAGIYSAQPGETLRHLIERAGGLTPNAYLFGAELTRESARIVQQQRLDDYVTQLELATDRAGAASAAGAITPTDQTANAASLAATQLLVNRLRQLRASGRVVLSLTPDADSIGSLPDLPVEDGDRFIVPPKPSSVNVVGAVYEQSTFLFDSQRRVYGYLKEAGGANRDADQTHAFVIRADGSVLSRASAKTFWGNEFDQARIHPGDTIVVPEKTYRGNGIRTLLDFSQLFSSIALGAGALAVITN
ncbi:MAG TPA: SLBB domain-containing protein [Acidobacteriaceae bacterium]|jgi:protein involved in polysaccharide export with SLBB domain